MNIEVLARYFILGCVGKGAGQVPLLPCHVVVVVMKAESHKMSKSNPMIAAPYSAKAKLSLQVLGQISRVLKEC